MKKESTLTLVSQNPIFNGIPTEEILTLLCSDSTTLTAFKGGDWIYSPDTEGKYLGIMISGTAEAHSVDSTNGVLLRNFEKGELFGVATLFAARHRFVSIITAKGPCKVLFLKDDDVLALIQKNQTFAMNYIHCLSERICFLNTRISCFTAGSPERKLAYFLCTQSPENSFSLTISANALSDMLDIGRASLYRVFDKFEQDGFIKKDGKTITLINRSAMIDFYK